MGGTYSEPVPSLSDTGGYVCFVLRSYDKARLLHASPEVKERITKIVCEICGEESLEGEDKHGSLQFRLPGSPFTVSAGRDSATIGKLFAIRVFEEMNQLGFDLVISADLSRSLDQGSWFFKKTAHAPTRNRQPVMCISPSGTDKLVLVRTSDILLRSVRAAIKDVWPYGIQNERVDTCAGERVQEFKLRGSPWQGEGEEGVAARKMLLQILAVLGKQNWRLLGTSNLKGTVDVFFFLFDELHSLGPEELAVMSMSRSDRLRILNFDYGINDVVRSTILRFYQTKDPEERLYHGATEFKLKGYPFATGGSEAVSARQFVCRLLEALREKGWQIYAAFDLSKKSHDKSVFVMRRCETARLKFACVAMADVDSLRFLNFPTQVTRRLRAIIERAYMPGIAEEFAKDATSYEITLQGYPWSQESSYNLHARSMLLVLLREAFQYGWHLEASADVTAKMIHTENGPDYPVDVHSWYFSFRGVPQGAMPMLPLEVPTAATPAVSYQELKVSDLEETPGPATPRPFSV